MSKFSVPILLATAAVTGSLMLSTANSALACPFNTLNRSTTAINDGAPTLNLPTQSNLNKLGIVSAGVALALALRGLAAYRARRKVETEPQAKLEETFSIPISPEVLAKAIAETANQEKVSSVD